MKPSLRNVFHNNDEEEQWKSVLNCFPNKVPRFPTKDTALEFTKLHSGTSSNPDYTHLQHSVSTLIDWDQINRYLIPKIKEYYDKWPKISLTSDTMEGNRFNTNNNNANKSGDEGSQKAIFDYLQSRLSLSIHQDMAFESTMNTLRYMFFHMKCGIFVMVRNNELAIFCPFVNKDYSNSWKGALGLQSSDGGVDSYYDEKADYYRREREQPFGDTSRWWANGNIICNFSSDQHWGDHFLLQLKDMFAECCSQRVVPDCEFFVNKRDYPHLKFNAEAVPGGLPVEPYGFIFDKDDRDPRQDVPLPPQVLFKSYAPIL